MENPRTIRFAYGSDGEITSATLEFDGGKEVCLVRDVKLPKPYVGKYVGKHSAEYFSGYPMKEKE